MHARRAPAALGPRGYPSAARLRRARASRRSGAARVRSQRRCCSPAAAAAWPAAAAAHDRFPKAGRGAGQRDRAAARADPVRAPTPVGVGPAPGRVPASHCSRGAIASSAAAVGVGARRSAQKSAIVKSVSCPTPTITGCRLATIACASCSSLNAHRSSMAPPPRTSSTRSTVPPSGSRPGCWTAASAAHSSAAAPAPCTRAGASTTCSCGARRRSALSTSCSAAAPSEVTTPMARGSRGNVRLRAGSNRPCACSRAFSCRNCSNNAPAPARCMLSATSCSSPRASYTVSRPRSSTSAPSCGVKSSRPAARRNIAQRNWPSESLREK